NPNEVRNPNALTADNGGFPLSSFWFASGFAIRISDLTSRTKFRKRVPSRVPWPQQNDLLLGAFDFDAVGFDARIIFESLMDDAAIEGVERFEFDHIAPAPNFFSRIHGFLDEGFARLGTVPTHIDQNFWRGR